MNKHKYFSAILILLAVLFIVLEQVAIISFKQFLLGIALLVFLYLSITAIGSYFIQMNFFVNSINKGQLINKSIALTFDDGPHENTLQVLEVLKKYQVFATFFIIGKHIENREYIIAKIIEGGHQIGNHSFEHSYWYSVKNVPDLVNDIQKNNACLEKISNRKITWFRPPYGVTNPRIAGAINKSNMKSIGWSIRSYDTVAKNIDDTFHRIIKQINQSEIVLMHDHLNTTAQLLDKLIPYCIQHQIEIVPLDKLIAE